MPRTVSKPTDPTSRTSRARLAIMVMRLFEIWKLSAQEQISLLGLSAGGRNTLYRYRNGGPLAKRRDLLERVGHLLGMHKTLHLTFPHDLDLAYRWMTVPNRSLGARPVDLIAERGFEGLLTVRRYLELECGR